MGVTVFFVISGFLLYRPFVAGDMTGKRRTADTDLLPAPGPAIFPAYWFALAAFALLPGVISVFTHDWWWGRLPADPERPDRHLVFQAGIGPAWSLSVELAFYFLLPFFALGMSKVAGGDPNQRLVRDLCVLTVLAVVSATVRALLVSDINANGGLSSSLTWTATLTLPLFLTWFCIGMAFASVSAWCAQTGTTPDAVQRLARQPGFVWSIALGGYALIVLERDPRPGGETPIHHLATGLVAAAFVFPAAFPHPQGEGLPARVLSVPAVAWIGLISYGIICGPIPSR